MRLPAIDLGHLQAAPREPLLEPLDDRRLLDRAARRATSATASRVTSSSVGPRPPVRMTRSARSSARRKCSATSRRSSPTTVFARSSMPSDGETVGEEQRVGIEPRRAEQLAADRDDFGGAQRRVRAAHATHPGSSAHQQAQRQVRVDRRHRIVGHDAEAAVQRLEPARGKRLDDVEDPEEDEAGERAATSRPG